MKQLRFIFLMLVACVAQVSMAQGWGWTTTPSPAISDEQKEGLKEFYRRELALAHNNEEANSLIGNDMWYSKAFDGLSTQVRLEKGSYGTAFYKSYNKYKYEYMLDAIDDWAYTIKDKEAKFEKKLSKGKKISNYDARDYALDIALFYATGFMDVFTQDFAKAIQYYKMAKEVGVGKNLDMHIMGCQYMIDKDKDKALANMTFTTPSKDLYKIAKRYDLEDVYAKKVEQLLQGKEQVIRRAFRSKDLETLKSFNDYCIPGVDTLLFSKYGYKLADYTKENKKPDELPSFSGDFSKWIQSQINQLAKKVDSNNKEWETEKHQGIARIYVGKDGATKVTIIVPNFSDEYGRYNGFGKAPVWKPAKLNGEAIPYKFTYRFTYITQKYPKL